MTLPSTPPMTRCQTLILRTLQDARAGFMTGESIRKWAGYGSALDMSSGFRALIRKGLIHGLDVPTEGRFIALKNQRWALTDAGRAWKP